MTCNLSHIKVNFVKSGLSFRPYTLDIRRSKQSGNTFDHAQAELKREAGVKIQDKAQSNEPIKIIGTEGGDVLYRGWYRDDAATLGTTKSTLKIVDPRKILKTGTVDKEWGRITLQKVVEYIVNRRQDPHNVITGVEIAEGKVDISKLQHPTADFPLLPSFSRDRTYAFPKANNALTDLYKETVPWNDGDGNFDFREESPHSALMQVCDTWETEFWVDQDGTLYIGNPARTIDIHGAGRGSKNWYISNWELPNNPEPLKAVVVKGKMDQKGGVDNNLEELWNVISNKKKFQTRAAAGFLNNDNLSETLVLKGKRETADPEVLKNIARRKFLKQHTNGNSGSVRINAMYDNNISQSQYCNVDVGDAIMVNNIDTSEDCQDIEEGLYGIYGLKHDISGDSGWEIRLDVNQIITDAKNMQTKFWYFDPTKSDMTEDNSKGGLDV